MTVSMRSTLAAGLAAAAMSATAVVPMAHSGSATITLPSITLPSIELSASVLPLAQPAAAAAGALLGGVSQRPAAAAAIPAFPGPAIVSATGSASDTIINAYNAIEPWVQWGFEVAAWAVSYLPWPLGWLGQQINIAYNTGEPIVQAVVYSFAYLIGGQFDLIGPTLMNGVSTAVTNLFTGEIAWVLSFLPPLPPISFPVLPGASVAARAAAVAAPAPARTRSTQTTVADNLGAETPVTEVSVTDNLVSDSPVSDSPVSDNPGAATIVEQPDATQSPAIEAPRGRRGVNRSAVRAQPATPAPNSPSHGAAAMNSPASAAETPVASTAHEPRGASRAAASRSAHPAQ